MTRDMNEKYVHKDEESSNATELTQRLPARRIEVSFTKSVVC